MLTHVYQGTHTLVRVDAGALDTLQLRVPGGEVIEQAPLGAEIEVALNLDSAIILAD